MSLWLDKFIEIDKKAFFLRFLWINCKSAGFITRLVYHNLFLKNSSLNCINQCDPKYRPPSYGSSFSQLVTALRLSLTVFVALIDSDL